MNNILKDLIEKNLNKKKINGYNSEYPMKINIYGAGPTGSLLALALSRNNYEITLLDPKSKEQILEKSRGYAITQSTRRLLERIGIWEELTSYLHPFSSLLVEDRVYSKSVLFTSRDLMPKDRHYQSVGWMLNHRSLMEILFKEIEDNDKIIPKLGAITNYFNDSSDLAVASDGVKSHIRDLLRIDSFKLNYSQSCLAMRVSLRGIDQSRAYEILRAEGPFAVLPMGNNVYQIVWSAPAALCEKRAKLKDSLLLDKIAAIIPENAQPDLLLDKPQVFRVSLSFPSSLFKGNTLLIGESAHTFHPVGGQGLNICWRDINTLLPLLDYFKSGELSLFNMKIIYTVIRYMDIFSIAIVTHSIVKIFSNKNYLLYFLRTLPFWLLNKSSLLRRRSLNFMTNGLFLNK